MGALCCCFGYNRHEPEEMVIRGHTFPDELQINFRVKEVMLSITQHVPNFFSIGADALIEVQGQTTSSSSSSSSSQRVGSSISNRNMLEVSHYQRILSSMQQDRQLNIGDRRQGANKTIKGASNKSHTCSESSTKLASAKLLANAFNLQTCSSIPEDEDCCPTCLEEYTSEDPKIIARCSHHYHLSCIYSWQERSPNCPICDRVLLFEEMS